MGHAFLELLNRSITASWLILAVICVRLIFRKMPKWMNCILWGVVAVRLICPVLIESPFSILPSTKPVQSSAIVAGEVQNYIPSIDSHLPVVENTINPMLTEAFAYSETASVAPLQVVAYIAGNVWICGMSLLMAYAVVSVIKLRRLVREAVCYRERIFLCDAVKSPFILGIIRPGIYLPSALNEEEMEYIIAHEQAHLNRRDHWWKPLGYLLLCVYWFNPLCHVAYAMLCRDIELACDEKVIMDMTFSEKKEYSRVLLSCAQQRRRVMACPLAFGEVGVKERVKSVLNYKKPAFWVLIAAIAVCVVMGVCFLTNPAKEYQIRITIPAGSTASFCYSDEEISPKGSKVTFRAGEGLGDSEIVLLPVEVKEENIYDEPAYITPGMPVRMKAEKGGWFKIGINVQNPTEESLDVYVSVSNVDVRIADSAGADESGWQTEQDPENEEDAQDEILSDMMVSNILTDSGLTAVSIEDAEALRSYLETGEWEDVTADCINNCQLTFPTGLIQYHSDCGTFNDPANDKHLSLSEADADRVNAILSKYISLWEEEVISEEESEFPEVMSITVTNGNNGEVQTFSRADSNHAFGDLLQLYGALDFSAETEEMSRVGYRYFMTLYDAEGGRIHTITPYKDGFCMDDTFYQYGGADVYDRASVNLLNYMDLLFYPE